jgi:hypothetical protein
MCAGHRYGTRVLKGSQASESMHQVMNNVLLLCSNGSNGSNGNNGGGSGVETWVPRLFDAVLHVMEGTWVVTSHEEDDERST